MMIRRKDDRRCRISMPSTSAMLPSSLKRLCRFFRQCTLLSICCVIMLIAIDVHMTDKTLQRTLLQKEALRSLRRESSSPSSSLSSSIRIFTVNESLQQPANYTSLKSGSRTNDGTATAELINDKQATATTSHTPQSASFADHNQSSTTMDTDSNNNKVPNHTKRQTIIMVTYVFGEDAINKRYLRLFIESVRQSGIDLIAIVGPTAPGYSLPPNVQHVPITWDELTDRVRDRIFDGKEPGTLRQAQNFYKVIDFKPFFAHLFPELVEGFDWWGHIDNDMILGNVRNFLNHDRLAKYDLIAAFPDEYTSGPFMVYRNTPAINELFRFAKQPLEEIFATFETRFFDEWGGGTSSIRHRNTTTTTTTNIDEYDDSYASTMAGIVDLYHERLGLRWFGGIPSVWDGFCRKRKEGMCTQCKLVVTSGGHQQGQTLYEEYRDRDGTMKHRRVSFCHFEFSKETIETSLSSDRWKHHLNGEESLRQGEYRINFLQGLTPAENVQ